MYTDDNARAKPPSEHEAPPPLVGATDDHCPPDAILDHALCWIAPDEDAELEAIAVRGYN